MQAHRTISPIAPSEQHLEDWLVAHCDELGWEMIGRQVRFCTGIVDLIAYDGDALRVIELKRQNLNAEALVQVLAYAGELNDSWLLMEQFRLRIEPGADGDLPRIVPMLIGHSVSDERFESVCTQFGVEIWRYNFCAGQYKFVKERQYWLGSNVDYGGDKKFVDSLERLARARMGQQRVNR